MTKHIEQIDPELLSSLTAVLATIGTDGRPQLSVIWFIVEDGSIKMSVTQARQKYKNLVSDARATVLVTHPESDNYYVEIRGDITLEDDLDYVFADRLGPPKYDTDMRSFDAPRAKRAVLSLQPTKINVIDVRGDDDVQTD